MLNFILLGMYTDWNRQGMIISFWVILFLAIIYIASLKNNDTNE